MTLFFRPPLLLALIAVGGIIALAVVLRAKRWEPASAESTLKKMAIQSNPSASKQSVTRTNHKLQQHAPGLNTSQASVAKPTDSTLQEFKSIDTIDKRQIARRILSEIDLQGKSKSEVEKLFWAPRC